MIASALGACVFPQSGNTQANVQRDFIEWHRGRPRYAVWAIDLADDVFISQRITEAQSLLSPYLLPGYRCQPHITLHVCGFPAQVQHHDDDYLLEQFRRQIDVLQTAGLCNFSLRVQGAGSFTTAPYFRVVDDKAMLPLLRQCLAVAGGDWRETPFVPHVTIGLYGGCHDFQDVASEVCLLQAMPDLGLTVSHLSLMTYDSAVVGGPLETLCRFDLANNLLETSPSFSQFSSP